MGYELTMLVVRQSSVKGNIALIGEKVYQVYKNKNGHSMYFPDHNTETLVPPEGVISKAYWCDILGVIELGKTSVTNSGICSFNQSESYAFLPLNGNDLIGLDSYGKYREFVPINDVIEEFAAALKNVKKRGLDPCPRWISTLAFLKAVKKENDPYTDSIGCMCYGH